jgi:hypothetical protein
LRRQKIALRGDFLPRSLPTANSIYPPLADSNGNSGIHAAGIMGIYTVGFYRKVEKVEEVFAFRSFQFLRPGGAGN